MIKTCKNCGARIEQRFWHGNWAHFVSGSIFCNNGNTIAELETPDAS